MIKEFTIHAKPTNKKATAAFTACFLSSFAILTLSTFMEKYRGIVQLLGMGLLVAALLFYTKYMAPKYFYEIVKVEIEGAEARRSHKTPAGVKKYSYVPTLSPEFAARIYTSGRHEKAEILIEVTEEIARLISDYAKEARELMAMREDEEEY